MKEDATPNPSCEDSKSTSKHFYYLALSLLGATCLFALYLEVAPGLGNIWIRPGIDGLRRPHIAALFRYILEPLRTPILWHYRLWDANALVVIPLLSICLYMLSRYNDHEMSRCP